MQGEPWGVKEGGDTGYIRHMTGKLLFPSLESLGLPYLIKADARYEEAWSVGSISFNDCKTITDFCVTTVSLVHDYCGGLGGSEMEKLTLWFFIYFSHYF